MTYKLVIVESPAKCSKIENILGKGYKCMASYGHIRQLNGLKAINIHENFTPTYTYIDEKMRYIKQLKAVANSASQVILATDDDREGEAIAWHICETLGISPANTPRIIFHEVTESAIKSAIRTPINLNLDKVGAQKARQILDVLVGYKISPLLWKKFTKKSQKGFSAGRCQTPALRLIYDNQKHIEKSPGNIVYKIIGYFTSKTIQFDLSKSLPSKQNAEAFLKNTVSHKHIFTRTTPKQVSKTPPLPFTTSRLQQSANNLMRYSPKDTMALCQTLYEGGYITYMRTDSDCYSKEFIKTCHDYICDHFSDLHVLPDVDSIRSVPTKTSNNAQEAHEAIRVTKLLSKENLLRLPLNGPALKLYMLIRNNTIASCMSPAKYNSITAHISSPDKSYKYCHTAENMIFDGWHAVIKPKTFDDNHVYEYLTSIKIKSVVNYKKITAKLVLKDMTMHLTEAGLVQQLEKRGIGRPSTYSSLVNKIQERGYVKCQDIPGKNYTCTDFELLNNEITEVSSSRIMGAERKKLVLQATGKLVIEYLTETFNTLFDYEYTAKLESELDKVSSGKTPWQTICGMCYASIQDSIEKAGLVEKVSIPIDETHTFIIGKYGPVIKCTSGSDNNETSFLPVKDDIDLTKLRQGTYKLSDIVSDNILCDDAASEKTYSKTKLLGKYNGNDLYLKYGKYGHYIECGNQKKSIEKDIESPATTLTFDVAKKLLSSNTNNNILRHINETMSIRKGKYGDYLFYKKPRWKRPRFIKLQDFSKKNSGMDYMICPNDVLVEWANQSM